MISKEHAVFYEKAKIMEQQHISYEGIVVKLIENGCEDGVAEEITKLLKKEAYSKKRSRGSVKILFGGVLLVIGFVLTCTNFHLNASFDMIMYGFTCAGLVFLFWGLYEIFG